MPRPRSLLTHTHTQTHCGVFDDRRADMRCPGCQEWDTCASGCRRDAPPSKCHWCRARHEGRRASTRRVARWRSTSALSCIALPK
eukprot:2278866-Prymnesium_polylepis.1